MTSTSTAWQRPAVLLALLGAISATLLSVAPSGTGAAGAAVVVASALTGAIALLDRIREQDRKLRALSERLSASGEARAREAARADQAVAQLATLQEQLVTADRRVGVGRVATQVAHEIANPLACVTGNLEWLESELERRRAQLGAEGPTPQKLADALDEMTRAVRESLQGAERVRCVTQQLRAVARGRDDGHHVLSLWNRQGGGERPAGELPAPVAITGRRR